MATHTAITRCAILAILVGAIALIGPGLGAARAQVPLGFPGLGVPIAQPPGSWAQIIAVTPKWIVLQNDEGQQFPVEVRNLSQFLVRSPANLASISPNTLIEATGLAVGGNQLQTDHIDLYDGAAQRLITPIAVRLIGNNRVLNPLVADPFNTFGFDLYLDLPPGELMMPMRYHVVGIAASLDPLQVASPGNNWFTVLPGDSGLTVTRITIGNAGQLQIGDMVYFVPTTTTTKSQILSQLVVYKPPAPAGLPR